MKHLAFCFLNLVFFISCSKPIILTAKQDSCRNPNEITGEGTQESPYVICSSKHLKLLDDYLSDADVNIRNLYNSAYYKQTANITLVPEDTVDFPIGNNTYQFANRAGVAAIMGEFGNLVYSFDGVYNGQNYSIKNYNYSAANQEDVLGLFDTLGANSIIKNLKLVDFDLTSDGSILVGGLAAVSAGLIENISIENINISGDGILVGGLLAVGLNSLSDISISGEIEGVDTIGGIAAGVMSPSEIELTDITNAANITSTTGATAGIITIIIGKIVGTNLSNSGSITSGADAAGIATTAVSGSLYGYGAGTDPVFTNTSNSGNISAATSAAGIFKTFHIGSVTGARNTGDINALDNAAGVFGNLNSSSVSNVSNTGNINADDYAAGVFNDLASSSASKVTNTGNITSKKSSSGIVSGGESFSLSQCFSSGNITVTNDYTDQWGDAAGILGAIYDGDGIVTFNNCYVTGVITTPAGAIDSGALVGDLWHFDGSLTITNTYTSMTFNNAGNNRGGTLVGVFTPDIDPAALISFDDSVYYVQTPEKDGPIGSDAIPVGFVSTAVEIQAADLTSAANFPEFDFINIWVMKNGQPKLR